VKANGKTEWVGHEFAMKCPVEGCETILIAPEKGGILKAWDRHRQEAHQPTGAQWGEAQKKIEEAAERSKR
jgi:hypothetical protein